MGEIDYQTALLLHHRFESESKNEESDLELARQLQEQFERENAIEKPPLGLVYSSNKREQDSTKSLIDPSWELVDPTPDVHGLFIAFNQRFFWNKLLAVCVSWSKRMTSCAGVCSYNGAGGMCSITLSEPLLKLRPRKDLVETLLHEMIHAFLFVTHNNKDRDGHGPEFHKHMFRINKETGTNITVYHDFHDEVRLYQQHWWRCDGPCQTRRPFFGMVRRATNRAPGPNDRWWAEHSRTCGGNFKKVKEPEKAEKKTIKKTNKDIRDFISTNNVKGFKDLNNKVKGRFNSSSTIVITGKTSTESTYKPTIVNSTIVRNTAQSNPTVKPEPTVICSNTNPIESGSSCSSDFLKTRDHWANRFNASGTITKKRSSTEEISPNSKIPKIIEAVCPVCSQKVAMETLNSHLDQCLIKNESTVLPTEETKECPICGSNMKSSLFDSHVEKCILQMYDDMEKKLEDHVSCLSCNKKIPRDELNTHLEDCIVDIFDSPLEEKNVSSCVNCPICMKMIGESEMQNHLDLCLSEDKDIVEIFADNF